MHLIRRTAGWRLVIATASVAVLVGVASGASLGADYDTYYCGTPTSWCTLGSGSAETTAGVAPRYWNEVQCSTGCHVHVWYDNGDGNGAYEIEHSNGADYATDGNSIGNAYARCETDSGYGTNQASCDTLWHD